MNLGRKFAFTLSEVVVVMAIIGILLAASAPVVTKRTGLTNKNMYKNFTTDNGHTGIYYGSSTDHKPVIIGDNEINTTNMPANTYPKLILIGFKDHINHIETPQVFFDHKANDGAAKHYGYFHVSDMANIYIGGQVDDTTKRVVFPDDTFSNNTVIGDASFFSEGTDSSPQDTTAIGAKSCAELATPPNNSLCIGHNSGIVDNYDIDGGFSIVDSIRLGNREHSYSGNDIFFGSWDLKGYLEGFASDIRLKNVGKEFTSGISEINQLTPYNFTYKRDTKKEPKVGVMAQDLQKVFPRAVKKNNDGYLYIRKDEMLYATINSIKELFEKMANNKEKIKTLEAKNATLKKQNKELQELYVELANRVNKI